MQGKEIEHTFLSLVAVEVSVGDDSSRLAGLDGYHADDALVDRRIGKYNARAKQTYGQKEGDVLEHR